MGEEKKKTEEKKPEEVKEKDVNKGEKQAIEDKPKEEEKKSEKNEENKENKDSKEEQPPPPPAEIVLRVYMHCESCARKVKKCLKDFNGVEDVITDCKTHKVVVKGEKADPLKVLDRVQKKTHRQVELLSPIPPKPPVYDPKNVEEKEPPKSEDKVQEPKVITVVLKVHMHCEACSLEIKKRIERMKEVEEAITDLKNSQVTVKGTFEATKLVEYIYKRTGRKATIIKQDPQEKKDDGKEDKKGENEKGEKKGEEEKGDKKEEGGGGGGGEGGGESGKGEANGGAVEGPMMVELKRNEFNYYPPRYAMEMYAYPPQIFSDENPNACSIM